MGSTVHEMPPTGYYLAREVGQLAGVSGRTIGQWARRGYIRASQSGGVPKVYSYQDVAEAMVVHELLAQNVSHATIKEAIHFLRDDYGTTWPLTAAQDRLLIPPDHPAHEAPGGPQKKNVVYQTSVNQVDTATRHPVLRNVDLVRIASDLRRGGWPARKRGIRHIAVDPDRLSGRPTIAGNRVAAEDVARPAARPDGQVILMKEYGLTSEEIEDAQEWWEAASAPEAA